MNQVIIQALQYIRNTGGNCPVSAFDDDYAPMGFLLLKDIIPKYAVVDNSGDLILTEAGEEALK